MAYTSGEGTPSILWSLCDHIPANLSLGHLSSTRSLPDPEPDLPTTPYWSRPCPFPPDLLRSFLVSCAFKIHALAANGASRTVVCLRHNSLCDGTQKGLACLSGLLWQDPGLLPQAPASQGSPWVTAQNRASSVIPIDPAPSPTVLSSQLLLLSWALGHSPGCFLPKPYNSL